MNTERYIQFNIDRNYRKALSMYVISSKKIGKCIGLGKPNELSKRNKVASCMGFEPHKSRRKQNNK